MINGLVFIGTAHSNISQKFWGEDEKEREARVRRHRRLIKDAQSPEQLTDAERELLAEINEQLADDHRVESKRSCPGCARPFTIVTVDGLEIDCCRFCRSIWFDPGELQHFSKTEKEIPSDDLAHRQSKYDCPVCGTRMMEYVFFNPHNLLVDRCPAGHGVYLEDRELERVLELAEDMDKD
jgi:Zn-finger nucleic acid-binding protein